MAFVKPNVNSVWANAGDIISPAGAKINQGWIAEIPDYEFENWIQNRQDQFNAHVNQYGVVVWDSSTEYQANKSYVQGSDGEIYRAKQTHFNQNPVNDTNNTYWQRAFDSFGYAYSKSESNGRFLQRSNNLSDVASAASARGNLSVYSKTESDSRYLNESNNLSDLDNAATARNNLGVYSTSDTYSTSQADARFLNESSNLSDLDSIAAARSNISVYSKVESDGRYLNEASNLSDLNNVATARSNLGVQSVAESDGKYLAKSSNLNDVQNKATARNNLSVYSKAQSDANYPNVSEFSSVKSTNGWQELPGGLIMQWGEIARTSRVVRVNFPTSFPNKALQVIACNTDANGAADLGTGSFSRQSFDMIFDSSSAVSGARWFAIGY